MDATCRTCLFWGANDADRKDGADRECRVRSPAAYTVPMRSDAVSRDARWPWTAPEDWCGEHPTRQRDRLAAMILPGLCAGPAMERAVQIDPDTVEVFLARTALKIADALLAEATRPPTPQPAPETGPQEGT